MRLLIVDDDRHYGALIRAITRRMGFVVDLACDGEAALELLERTHYDVAIIDLDMPRLTGIDVIDRIRGNPATRDLYSRMLTGVEDPTVKLSALAAGFDDFLTKRSSDVEIAAKLVSARRIAIRQRTLDTALRELSGLAMRDDLTGVFNRRFLLAETERLLGGTGPLSLVLFDLDDFKQINDTYGHLCGDRVLRDVGALFHRSTRPEDLIARFGGDEFVMVVAELDLPAVTRIAERLIADVKALQWSSGVDTFHIGVTIGVASSSLLAEPTVAQLIDAADRDLYKNKWIRKHPDVRLELYEYPAADRAAQLVLELPVLQPLPRAKEVT